MIQENIGILQALVLGLVQGLPEFLPISSTAHLRIIPEMMNWEDPGAAYSAVIQLGTLLAIIIYFRKEVLQLSLGALISITKKNLTYSKDSRLAWSIALGTVPIVFCGLTFKDFIETEARALNIVGTSLIVLAVFLFLSDKFSKQNITIENLGVRQVI